MNAYSALFGLGQKTGVEIGEAEGAKPALACSSITANQRWRTVFCS